MHTAQRAALRLERKRAKAEQQSKQTPVKLPKHQQRKPLAPAAKNPKKQLVIEPPPRLELPDDLRSNPFSKSTYWLPVPTPPPCEEPENKEDELTEPFRLMDLPVELRLYILSLHFGQRTVAITFDKAVRKSRNFYSCDHARRTHNNLAILLTCYQLSKEAEDALWACTTFIVRVQSRHETTRRRDSAVHKARLKAGRSFMLVKMRRAIFHFDSSLFETRQIDPIVSKLMKHIASGNGLTTAELHFDFGVAGFESLFPHDSLAMFLDLKAERVRKISSVMLRRFGDTSHYCIPANESEDFRRLIEHFKAIDVSEQQCGGMMPAFYHGNFREVDARIIDNK